MTDTEIARVLPVFVGVDVGKGVHHEVALHLAGKRLLDRALANDEVKLRALIINLKERGSALLIVDHPGAINVAFAMA